MAKDEAILRFNKVSFGHDDKKPLLNEVDFSIRRGTKTTVMGQNGAGKSTLFGLITKEFLPGNGIITVVNDVSIALSRQVIPREELDLTVKEFFEKALSRCTEKKVYDIDPKIDETLEIVHLKAPHDKIIKSFSGGQQARLLLASALIQNPDLLLLDEPTNNLDKAGIEHLTQFLIGYDKTCIVISHDAGFLNSFTDGVLYLDVFTRKIEQYTGNYFDVREQIAIRQEKENRKNAQLIKEIKDNREKANFFANKGGKLRLVAKKMREKADEAEEDKVEIRREDKTIRSFVIPSQADIAGIIVNISSFKAIKNHKTVQKKTNIELWRGEHLLLKGPNGIGKSSLLELIAKNEAEGTKIAPNINIGYYRQDFSTLNFEDTVYKSLSRAAETQSEELMRNIAAGFLITGDMMKTKIGDLSEGQKGLVAFARLVLQKPGLLILDEPTNHINFRHIPIIAEALNKYSGAMIIVSHVPDFVSKIKIDKTLDLED
ncbi:MAG: ABC-F family ATP-binding cassette domain-containing protein [Candidatus Pacebacteria bacterium]|nr:ABC-F family ATP-binding cassette domain-containing protein [Candidatus Paceibacterota bacterium]